jgi:hypothetical protein
VPGCPGLSTLSLRKYHTTESEFREGLPYG